MCFNATEMTMSDYSLSTVRHSAAHIMAAAVQGLYPDAKFDIGPATEDGFYYDFDMEHRLTPEDLKTIEKAMKKLMGRKLPFEKTELTRTDAEKILNDRGQTYKLIRLSEIPEGETISFYTCADFVDLCRGPHVEHTGQVGAVKLMSIAGSYFHGKEGNPMLQRIYGTAFPSKEELDAHLLQLEEAKKRDHRKLGVELDLFSMSDSVGPGLVLWHPKGAFIRHTFESYWKDEHYKNGYELMYSPHVGRSVLWQTSGHLDFYKENMYAPMEIDNNEYYVKPMNCPFHIEIYKSRLRSYRELPCRWAELGTVYRYEPSGVLHGLLRARGFTQDDAHIICTPEQVEDEIAEVLRFSLNIWKTFGFTEIKPYLATKPDKSVGDPQRWQTAINALENAVKKAGLECEVDEGGGAFYGPKIDLKIKDAIGREWQTTTIQFDFNLPERFNMTYVGEDGQRHQPFMIHRALFGSIERFFGVLVEHFAGAFPVWLAPIQAKILPISEKQLDYALKVGKEMRQAGLRVEVDERPAKIGAKIKDARHERIQYILVAGDSEMENGTCSVRSRREDQLGELKVSDIIAKIVDEVVKKI
jgi:threonyl-tRNA synthetase